jgi:biofilm PGA synthesis lipoprotein PgaB
MSRALFTLLGLCWLGAALATEPTEPQPFHVLAYHDVRDTVRDDFDHDQYAISTRNLIDHFTWLEVHGFTPVSIDDLIAAERGIRPLPEKAVLLTFDDGFKSVYTHVYPLLELFDYPAVVSIVTEWIESGVAVEQAGRTLTRSDFLTWDEIAELGASRLVEIASHSHGLHRGIPSNPQGNQQPAAVSAGFANGAYEGRADYAARIHADLAHSVALIERHTGTRPRVIAWPYGAHNATLDSTAAELGMAIDLTLDDGTNDAHDLHELARHLIQANPGVEALAYALLHPAPQPLVRAAQVDLDYVYSEDPEEQERNLGRLLDRIRALEITHVFLQAFADPDADGGAQALYFPNSLLPMRADLFNRVAWQLKTRANVLVYAWLPLLSFEGPALDPDWYVMQAVDGELTRDAAAEPRLSPFVPQAVDAIKGVYRDLAIHANFDGLLFHDDGRFNELEDANPQALEAYKTEFGEEFELAVLANDTALTAQWASLRARRLIELSAELTSVVREHRPSIKTARNLFAPALLDASSAPLHLAQDYDAYLRAYDYVALMAMPGLEGAADADRFYTDLAAIACARDPGARQTIFELQTVDWRTGRQIPASELKATMRRLQALGIRHLAYYPDDYVLDHPELGELRQGLSIASFPRGFRR